MALEATEDGAQQHRFMRLQLRPAPMALGGASGREVPAQPVEQLAPIRAGALDAAIAEQHHRAAVLDHAVERAQGRLPVHPLDSPRPSHETAAPAAETTRTLTPGSAPPTPSCTWAS